MAKDDEQRAINDAAKQAIREFLDEKFSTFGKWSFGAIAALALAALTYFILSTHGWHK